MRRCGTILALREMGYRVVEKFGNAHRLLTEAEFDERIVIAAAMDCLKGPRPKETL